MLLRGVFQDITKIKRGLHGIKRIFHSKRNPGSNKTTFYEREKIFAHITLERGLVFKISEAQTALEK